MPPESRRRSKLADGDPLGLPVPAVAAVASAPVPRGAAATVLTRSQRRRAPEPEPEAVPETDPELRLVSFNCKMTVACRRAVRTLAAQLDVDIQDVVEDAMVLYLADREIEVPRRPVPHSPPGQQQ